MFKFGFEKEYFVYNDSSANVPVIPADYGLPYDGGGLLAEARSEPSYHILNAAFLLKAEEVRLERIARDKGVWLSDFPYTTVPRTTIDTIRRRFAKDIVRSNNIYGHSRHNNSTRVALAGLHISITKRRDIYNNDKVVATVNEPWDYVPLIKLFDSKFKRDIKVAKRKPGFYELKTDGRFEYRSLPSDVDLMAVVTTLEEFIR